MRVCSFCKKEKPSTLKFFYICKKNKSGLRRKCKECTINLNKINKQKRRSNGIPCWTTIKRRKDAASQHGVSYEVWCKVLMLKKEIAEKKKKINKLMVRLNKFKYKNISQKNYDFLKNKYKISKVSWLKLTEDNPSHHTLIYRVKYRYDTNFNLKEKLRNQLIKKKKKYPNLDYSLRLAVSENQNTKYLDILGYKKEELKNHLEKQFTKDMTWKAFRDGKIHIDHIKPQSLFNLKDINDIKECWSLNNLQPLWAKDNIAKSNKYKEK